MAYVIGIDGGGTKTQGLLCHEAGTVFGKYMGGPSNHQFISGKKVQDNIGAVVGELLKQSGLEPDEIKYAYLGLAGNDSEDDCRFLTELLKPVMGGIPYCIENDLWAAMASMPDVSWGVIAVCGTGYNMAVLDRKGKRHTLRALEYQHGNISATRQLITEALHAAFQSEEHTGTKTKLESEIPGCLGVNDMEEVLALIQRDAEKVYSTGEIVRAVFALARRRDEVCQDILIGLGRSIGRMLGNFIVHTGLAEENVPIILSGSIFVKAVSRLHIDAMVLELRRYVPDFSIIINRNPAAQGACAAALKAIGEKRAADFFEKMGEG